MKIFPQPRMLGRQHVVHGADEQHFLVAKYGDPVACGFQAVEVMRYHENGQPQSALQGHDEFVEITAEVRRAVGDSGLQSGAVVVYCPHTTAGVTIQENADPDVVHDILLWLNEHIPKDVPGFRHGEGNSDSHLKSSLVGTSVTVLVEDGDLVSPGQPLVRLHPVGAA